jgi:hypothetical protein
MADLELAAELLRRTNGDSTQANGEVKKIWCIAACRQRRPKVKAFNGLPRVGGGAGSTRHPLDGAASVAYPQALPG